MQYAIHDFKDHSDQTDFSMQLTFNLYVQVEQQYGLKVGDGGTQHPALLLTLTMHH